MSQGWATEHFRELDIEYDSRFCERLVQWQKVRWGVSAGVCAVEDTQSSVLCLCLCVQGSSLPKPEHWVPLSRSKPAALMVPWCPGSSLQHAELNTAIILRLDPTSLRVLWSHPKLFGFGTVIFTQQTAASKEKRSLSSS